jgi:hypothetical protein
MDSATREGIWVGYTGIGSEEYILYFRCGKVIVKKLSSQLLLEEIMGCCSNNWRIIDVIQMYKSYIKKSDTSSE